MTLAKVLSTVKGNKLFKNMSIYFLSQMINAFLPIIIIPIISRTLSMGDYGEFSLYKSVFGFLVPIVGLSFSNAVIRKYYTIDKKDFKTYMLALMIIITGVAVFLYAMIWLNTGTLLQILKIKSPMIIYYSLYVAYLCCISNVVLGYYRVLDQTSRYLITNVIGVVVTLGGVILLKYTELLTLSNLLLVLLLANLLQAVYNMFTFFDKEFKVILDFSNVKDTFRYCSPLVVYSILAQIYAVSDRFIINYYDGKDSVALYSAGIQMAFVIPIIGQSIQLAWTPYVFERLTLKTASEKLRKITLILVGLLIVFTIFYMIIYPYIFKLFLPRNYDSVLDYYFLFVLAGLFQSLYWLYNPFLLYLEKNSFFIYITLIAAVMSLVLNFLFVKNGLIWVASTFALSWLVQFIFLLITISYVKNLKKTV